MRHGNRTSDPGYDRDFGYDDLNRLVSANTGMHLWRTGSYSYEAMGNMTSLRLGEVLDDAPDDLLRLRPKADVETRPLGRVTTFSYQGTTPKLDLVSTNDLERPVTYDAAGNELSYAVSRDYTARNLLGAVSQDLEGTLHRIAYGYDGRGVRVTRSEPSAASVDSRRYFFYTPELQLLAVTSDDEPNAWARRVAAHSVAPPVAYEIVWFAGKPVAQLSPTTPPRYTFTDHLGTPLLQTGPTATITWRAEHEPFGNVYELREGTRPDQPLRLPGQELAMTWEGTEENYNVFRWYRSGWGRYSQSDPIGLAAGMNLHAYVDSNPVNYSDPLGLIKPVHPSKQKWRPCNTAEEQQCQATCKYGMQSCMVSQTFKVIKMTDGKTLYGWVDGPMSCSCKEPSCWEKLKDWATDPKKWFDPNPAPPLPPFLPIPPSLPTPKPVIPGAPPFFINPCTLNPSLCYGDTGIA